MESNWLYRHLLAMNERLEVVTDIYVLQVRVK